VASNDAANANLLGDEVTIISFCELISKKAHLLNKEFSFEEPRPSNTMGTVDCHKKSPEHDRMEDLDLSTTSGPAPKSRLLFSAVNGWSLALQN
jgi:hypothetical protein